MAIVDVADGVKFGRTEDKSRVPVFFEMSNDAVDDLPKRYKYSKADSDWVEVDVTGFTSNLLNTTVQSLGLTDAKYASTAKGTSSNSKVWKVKVLKAESSVTRDESGVPSGSPAEYTYFSIPVPGWLTVFLFAHSVYAALKADSSVFVSDGDNSPSVDDIVAFISPAGRSYSGKALDRIASTDDPPSDGGGSGGDPTP